jgi:uncharacterized phage-associated protein
MSKALEVANFFLFQSEEEAGDVISNLKLQKLLYYAQGLHLAKFGKPLFDEKVEAWMHGPVVPVVYHHFKQHGDKGLPKPDACPKFGKVTQDFLSTIYRTYGQYSAWKLRNFTHDEPPWKNTPQSKEIPRSLLTEFFKTQLA